MQIAAAAVVLCGCAARERAIAVRQSPISLHRPTAFDHANTAASHANTAASHARFGSEHSSFARSKLVYQHQQQPAAAPEPYRVDRQPGVLSTFDQYASHPIMLQS